jgi:hypothetical protein
MFRHQVALNWKKYQKLTIVILLIPLSRMFGEINFGWAPLNYIGVFKLALIAIGGLAGLAFLKTLWQLGTARYRQLCTFVAAVRKFSRDYWSTKNLAA